MMRNREVKVGGSVRKQREMWAETDMGRQGSRSDSQRHIHGEIKKYGKTEIKGDRDMKRQIWG